MRRARRIEGTSQSEWAEKLGGIDASAVSRVESGFRAPSVPEFLVALEVVDPDSARRLKAILKSEGD